MAYVPNATDFSVADAEQVQRNREDDIAGLKDLGLDVRVLDLKRFFKADPAELERALDEVSGVWMSGGNMFILRQAMQLSGFDALISAAASGRADFVYGGYSAGCCVLSASLRSYQFASDANDMPYPGLRLTLWDGLGLIDFAFMPHFQSDHAESALIDKEIAYCEQHGLAYRPLKDGEVLMC